VGRLSGGVYPSEAHIRAPRGAGQRRAFRTAPVAGRGYFLVVVVVEGAVVVGVAAVPVKVPLAAFLTT